jgi:hypothetical protein
MKARQLTRRVRDAHGARARETHVHDRLRDVDRDEGVVPGDVDGVAHRARVIDAEHALQAERSHAADARKLEKACVMSKCTSVCVCLFVCVCVFVCVREWCVCVCVCV